MRDNRTMLLLIGSLFAGLAALVHVYIFVLESVRWTLPSTRRIFGTTAETAEVTRPLAFNQGFYNLFLAIEVALGVVLLAVDGTSSTPHAVGLALTLFGVGSMLAAALVLLTRGAKYTRAAITQGALPLIAAVLLLVG